MFLKTFISRTNRFFSSFFFEILKISHLVSLGGRAKSLDGVQKFTKVVYKECDFGEHTEEVK